MTVILELWRLRQEYQKFKTNKGYLRLSKNGNRLERWISEEREMPSLTT